MYLVRHAKAGTRREWGDDDHLRPLVESGRRQADALAERLQPLAAGGELVSSPYTRCVQTLEPLAARLGLSVRADERLAEETGFAPTLELLDELPEGSVLCSHGDVIPEVIEALQRRGCNVIGTPDWRKGSVWELRRNEFGQWVEACPWPPPNG
jgi:8-oxo-dGTP diphosphatase